MKAVVITKPGAAEVLEVMARPIPMIGSHDVLIKVVAAGINWPDVIQRKGHYPPPPGAPIDIPGLEVAGVIESVGGNCRRWKNGDKVCALLNGGGYAEYCVAPEGQCLPIPENLSFEEAASLPETYFTVWSNVIDRGRLKPGERFFVHGGGGGIGVAAIQLAKAWGAKVYTTAGSDEKCQFCIALGADLAINYKREVFKDVMHEVTNGNGVDVILDIIGGPYAPDNLDMLSEEGRLVMINHTGGETATIKLSMILRKRLTVTGSTLRNRDVVFKSSIATELESIVWPWLRTGKVKPVVYKVMPFMEAVAAHRLIESSHHTGKIVLKMGSN
ncbi:MAG: NAD(P)H-quinone oxidoreductase [Chryseolinea sp.]